MAAWSPQSKILILYRSGDEHLEKIFVRENTDGSCLTSFCFIFDDQYCLAGLSDGRVQLISTNSSNELFEWQLGQDNSAITSIMWTSQSATKRHES